MSSSYQWNKNHLSKEVLTVTYILEKMFFAVVTCIMLGLYESSLDFQKRQEKYEKIIRSTLVFLYVDS